MICDIVKNDKGDYCRSINHEQSIISGTLIDYCQMSKSFPEGIMVEAYNPDDTRLNKGIIYTKYLISIHKNGYSIGRCDFEHYDECTLIAIGACPNESME